MSKVLNMRSARLTAGSGAFAAAIALGGSLLAATPAHAYPPPAPAPARPYGTVVTPSGVNERQYPSTDSSVRGFLKHRSQVGLKCKVRAQNINGNQIWYLLRDRPNWVTAKYVDNTGFVKYCKDVQRSPLNDTMQSKTAMG
ncbi:SH3 domain-containing protein [Streptomyces sp. NPDC051776]|uniref:SH3 domain-containing protein n=1 Tax=Streptomyces sp. NPDC051776 TaxID=3155414 RepID=UPI0034437F76